MQDLIDNPFSLFVHFVFLMARVGPGTLGLARTKAIALSTGQCSSISGPALGIVLPFHHRQAGQNLYQLVGLVVVVVAAGVKSGLVLPCHEMPPGLVHVTPYGVWKPRHAKYGKASTQSLRENLLENGSVLCIDAGQSNALSH